MLLFCKRLRFERTFEKFVGLLSRVSPRPTESGRRQDHVHSNRPQWMKGVSTLFPISRLDGYEDVSRPSPVRHRRLWHLYGYIYVTFSTMRSPWHICSLLSTHKQCPKIDVRTVVKRNRSIGYRWNDSAGRLPVSCASQVCQYRSQTRADIGTSPTIGAVNVVNKSS